MIGGRLLQNRVISSDHCERKDGTDPSASVSVTVAVRTKDRFRFVTPEEVNDTGPDNFAYLYSSMEACFSGRRKRDGSSNYESC